ncbi:ABC transporter permease [Mariniblastus sp.]|jgi:putative ABC transport system permease protein|nr:ABC transporter permease [bacterium]MDC0284058.1 ABC transporter permease [Mariniblastus sp.]
MGTPSQNRRRWIVLVIALLVTTLFSPQACLFGAENNNPAKAVSQYLLPKKSSKKVETDLVVSSQTPKQTGGNSLQPARFGITRKDFDAIRTTVSGIRIAVPIRAFNQRATYGEADLDLTVVGTADSLTEIEDIPLAEGRFLTEEDVSKMNNVAVISKDVAQRMFNGKKPIGKNIKIQKDYFIIVGVTESNGPDLKDTSSKSPKVFIPITTMQARFGDNSIKRKSGSFEMQTYELSEVRCAVEDKKQMSKTMATIERLLSKNHKTEDYSIDLSK